MTVPKKLVYITRRERFNAAHKLYNSNWTEEENDAFFGKCSNKNFHGHNFELFVTLKGTPNPETGMVVDLKKLKLLIREQVTNQLDHRNLNEDVPFLKNEMPSIENMVVAIWNILAPRIENGKLHCIKLVETENNYVEYFGE